MSYHTSQAKTIRIQTPFPSYFLHPVLQTNPKLQDLQLRNSGSLSPQSHFISFIYQHFSNFGLIFTDGSKTDSGVGYAPVWIPSSDQYLCFYRPSLHFCFSLRIDCHIKHKPIRQRKLYKRLISHNLWHTFSQPSILHLHSIFFQSVFNTSPFSTSLVYLKFQFLS